MTDTTDLIQRLKAFRGLWLGDGIHPSVERQKVIDALEQQAAQIEALRADAERLRAVADAASVYYEHYMQDEAESPEYCVCGDEQHQRAVEVRDSLAALRQEQPTKGEGA